jgi:hypothetical protein
MSDRPPLLGRHITYGLSECNFRVTGFTTISRRKAFQLAVQRYYSKVILSPSMTCSLSFSHPSQTALKGATSGSWAADLDLEDKRSRP